MLSSTPQLHASTRVHTPHSSVAPCKAPRRLCKAAATPNIEESKCLDANQQQQNEGFSNTHSSRRSLMLAAQALVAGVALQQQPALAERGLSKYIKKKALDPLEFYVPVVLEAREQLSEAGEIMGASPDIARQMLRSGPFGAIRENVRVLGEYAVINGQADMAAPLVTGFFKALEDYDLELRLAVKQDKELNKERAVELVQRTLKALDDLLATVPEDILAKSRTVLEVARKKSLVGLEESKDTLEAADMVPMP